MNSGKKMLKIRSSLYSLQVKKLESLCHNQLRVFYNHI